MHDSSWRMKATVSSYPLWSLQVYQLISGCGMPSAAHSTFCSPLMVLFSCSASTLAETECRERGGATWCKRCPLCCLGWGVRAGDMNAGADQGAWAGWGPNHSASHPSHLQGSWLLCDEQHKCQLSDSSIAGSASGDLLLASPVS